MGETYYDVLGVDPDASAEEIRAAYRDRVLETHPDHNDAPDAAEQFKRVSRAESVLTDGDERARYDRLGHDAYVRLAEHSAGASGANDTADADSSSNGAARDASGDSSDGAGATGRGSTSGSRRGATSGRRTGSGTRSSTGAATGTRDGRSRRHRTRTGSDSDRGAGESHHARQRKRRRQQRARQRATSGWSLGTESAADAGTAGPSASGSASHASGMADDRGPGDDAFRYDVHDWTDDVDLEWEGQSLEYSTAVTIACCWLLYPILVVSILTSAFPLLVNGIIFACTLGVVGYTLTRPRIAAVLFGSWSVLFPIGIDWFSVSQFSLPGLVALGFAWVPFGYAVALWWALRP